jgi:hypothetical protein
MGAAGLYARRIVRSRAGRADAGVDS